MIKITVPNDDHVALRAMAKALEEIAVARGAPKQSTQIGELKELVKQVESDTTSQQVESLAIPVEANGATYETDLGCDKPEVRCVADSTDTPWDERIHSASKALNSDGTWRLRRKPKDMDEAEWGEYVETVRDELFVKKPADLTPDDPEWESFDEQSIMEEAANFDKPEPSVTPTGDDFHVDAGEVTEQQIAAIPAPPLPPVPSVFATVQEVDELLGLEPTMTFPQVMQFLTERHGRITSAQVDDIIADMGLNSIMDLNTQPEHTGPFIARVKALLGE